MYRGTLYRDMTAFVYLFVSVLSSRLEDAVRWADPLSRYLDVMSKGFLI